MALLFNTEEPPFLTFLSSCKNGVISDLILSCITEGVGGYQTILRLRKVCSTTRNWFDNLCPTQLQRHFPQLRVSINLCRKNIADFLQNPPPLSVATLHLLNTEYLLEDENDHSTEEKKLIRQFACYWHPKLEILEIGKISDIIIETFCSSPKLRSIRCESLQKFYPDFLRLENLSVKHLRVFNGETSFFTQMAGNKNLKSVEITVSVSALEGLTLLIDSRKSDKKFKLIANLGFGNKLKHYRMDDGLLENFVTLVASSLSSIHLGRVSDYVISKFLQVTTEAEMKENFFKRVEGIEFQYSKDINWIAGLFRDDSFANLKRFDEDSALALSQHFDGNNDRVDFPQSLEHLSVSTKLFFRPDSIPKCLTYLNMNGVNMSVAELQNTFVLISDKCPKLEEFKITWFCYNELTPNEILPRYEDKLILQNLKSLSVNFIFPFENNMDSATVLLLSVLKVGTLKIQHFSLEATLMSGHTFKMILGSEYFSSILVSPVTQTLLSHRYKNVVFVEDAPALFEELTAVLEENSEEHQKIHGRRATRNYMLEMCERESFT